MQVNRRRILSGVVIFALVTVTWIGYSIYSSYHTLKLTLPSDVQAQVYEAAQGDGATELSYNPDSLVGETVGSHDFRLRDGQYVIVIPKQKDYRELRKAVLMDGHDQTNTVEPEFNASKLMELLQTEEPTAVATLSSKYPLINLYEIQPGKLHKQGEWYTTTLRYKDQTDIFSSDTLRAVLHKKNGSWEVVTDPPEIIISKVVYQDIPDDIIDDINDR